ncbi:MAG: MCE family protein [Actinomycetota bacterium]|nr:MCE family protein [Actinomycetota bacterium]
MKIPERTRLQINLIAFLILAMFLAYAMANQVLSILQERITVTAFFEDAGGVFTNQEVTYRGITVGQVGELRVVEDGVAIDLKIKKGTLIPAEDVEARVMFKSAVGEQFVDLLPATDVEPYLEDGDEIPMSQTSIPVSTQELLTSLEGVLRGVPPEDLKGAIDALGIGLTGTGPDIATLIESLADLAELFAERAPEFEGILRSGTQVGDAFLESKEDFIAAINDLEPVAAALSDSTENLKRLLTNTNLTSEEVIALLKRDRAALNEFISDFAEVNDLQAEHQDDLLRLLTQLPLALGNVNKTFEPATGMVRFGLVQDENRQPCSYGRARKSPEDRNTGPPPKNLSCESPPAYSGRAESTTSEGGTPTALERLLTGDADLIDPGSSLPARMSDWSWTLFYLHSV